MYVCIYITPPSNEPGVCLMVFIHFGGMPCPLRWKIFNSIQHGRRDVKNV